AGGLRIVGVTGSSGKTSTKDLLAAVLAPLGSVVAPPGSFNNELGHPWTVLRADRDTDYLVLEMSARHRGNIAALAEIAPPSVGAAPATPSPPPRPNWPKPFHPPAWWCSTPTTRRWPRWPSGPRPGW